MKPKLSSLSPGVYGVRVGNEQIGKIMKISNEWVAVDAFGVEERYFPKRREAVAWLAEYAASDAYGA